MRQVIETVLEADVEQYAKNLRQAERDTQAFKRRIEDSQAIKLSLDVATIKKEIERAKSLLVKYRKEGNLEATVKLDADIERLKLKLTSAKAELRNYAKVANKEVSVLGLLFGDIGKKIDGSAQSFQNFAIKGAAILATAATVSQFVGEAIRLGNQLEQTTIAFETMLGSAEKADQLLRQLTSFAMTTPFTISGLRDTTKQLLAFGIEQEKILPTLKML